MLSERGKSINGFRNELEAAGVRGGSHASLHTYLRGAATPKIDFAAAVADLLDVELTWLITGVGNRYRGAAERAGATDTRLRLLQREVQAQLPNYSRVHAAWLSSHALQSVVYACAALHDFDTADLLSGPGQDEELSGTVEKVLKAIYGAGDALFVDRNHWADLPALQLNALFNTMAQAVIVYAGTYYDAEDVEYSMKKRRRSHRVIPPQ
mgnify:CR=1 FL=1